MLNNLSSELIKRAEEIYDRLLPTIEKKNYGQYIVIDPISNEYFIANKLATALIEGKTKIPGREFFTRRIGFKGVASFSAIHFHIGEGIQ